MKAMKPRLITDCDLEILEAAKSKKLVGFSTVGAAKAARQGEELEDERLVEIGKTISAVREFERIKATGLEWEYIFCSLENAGRLPGWVCKTLGPLVDGRFGRFEGRRPAFDNADFRKAAVPAMRKFIEVWAAYYAAQADGTAAEWLAAGAKPRSRSRSRGRGRAVTRR